MKVIACLMAVSISLSSAAQHNKEQNKKDRFLPLITRSLGLSIQPFDGLNSRVASLPQYKQLRDYAATLGLGWIKEQNRFISEAGITIGSSMSGNRDKKSSTIRYINFSTDIGYDLLKSEKITLYPLIGLGFQKYQAIFYKDNSGVNFNDVLASPVVQNSIGSVRFTNGFLVYRAGLGISFKSPKYPSNSIGIQAGYTGSFKKHDWKTNEGQTLNNSPEDRISQFFVSLVLTSNPRFMMK
ncbi:MAG: hypothetical protein JWM28_298 [Chitinophagaceae bacterium]|nr:hypothetical protein [Chitinophagaceae bacterium]